MAKITFYEAHLCAYYKELIQFNRTQRDSIKNSRTLAAINMNLILCIACFLEGVLEDRGNLLLGYYNTVHNCVQVEEFGLRKTRNVMHHNIAVFFHDQISKTTGIDKWDNIFKIFLDKSFKEDEKIKALVEGINVLYQLRNVIAHGRQAFAYNVEASYINGTEEHFMGGYKKAEEYLLKKKLLESKFSDNENLDIYFTNEIADHFFDIAQEFIKVLDDFIKENLIITDELKEKLIKYNTNNKTSITIYGFFRSNGIAWKPPTREKKE